MAKEGFGTDPYGIIAAGPPGGGSTGTGIGGSGVNVGRVGMPIAGPGFQTHGTGFGASYSIPLTQAGSPGPKGGAQGRTQLRAKGGKVKKMAKGGSTASKRADGCATKGKTKGKFV